MPSSACGRGSGSAGGILWPRICQYCLDQEIMATSGRRIDLEYTYSSYTAIPSYTQLYTALWPNFPLFDSQWISLQMILQAAEHRTSIVGRKQKQSTFNATFSIILIATERQHIFVINLNIFQATYLMLFHSFQTVRILHLCDTFLLVFILKFQCFYSSELFLNTFTISPLNHLAQVEMEILWKV